MSSMNFRRDLADYLSSTGEIYTVRKYQYDLTQPYIFVLGSGRCKREFVCEVLSKTDMLPYAEKSGLGTVDKWWTTLMAINPGRSGRTFYMYKVTKAPKDGN